MDGGPEPWPASKAAARMMVPLDGGRSFITGWNTWGRFGEESWGSGVRNVTFSAGFVRIRAVCLLKSSVYIKFCSVDRSS